MRSYYFEFEISERWRRITNRFFRNFLWIFDFASLKFFLIIIWKILRIISIMFHHHSSKIIKIGKNFKSNPSFWINNNNNYKIHKFIFKFKWPWGWAYSCPLELKSRLFERACKILEISYLNFSKCEIFL